MTNAEFELCAAHLRPGSGPRDHWVPKVGDECVALIHRLDDPRRAMNAKRCRVTAVRRDKPQPWDRKDPLWGGSGFFYTLEVVQ